MTGWPDGIRPPEARPLPERSRAHIRAVLLAAEHEPDRRLRFGALALAVAAVLVVIGLVVGVAVVLRLDDPPTIALPDRPTPPSDVAAKISVSEAMMATAIEPDMPGCSTAILDDGDLVWSASRGMADVAARRPLRGDSVFETAMSTRQFVASAALLLAEEGRLGLDHPVNQYVPGLPPWGGEVTVDQLIHHTSGIPDYFPALEAQGVTLSDRVTRPARSRPSAASLPQRRTGSGFQLLQPFRRRAAGRGRQRRRRSAARPTADSADLHTTRPGNHRRPQSQLTATGDSVCQ